MIINSHVTLKCIFHRYGNLMDNFLRLPDELNGDEFFAFDVEDSLIECAMLLDKSHVPAIGSNDND